MQGNFHAACTGDEIIVQIEKVLRIVVDLNREVYNCKSESAITLLWISLNMASMILRSRRFITIFRGLILPERSIGVRGIRRSQGIKRFLMRAGG